MCVCVCMCVRVCVPVVCACVCVYVRRVPRVFFLADVAEYAVNRLETCVSTNACFGTCVMWCLLVCRAHTLFDCIAPRMAVSLTKCTSVCL